MSRIVSIILSLAVLASTTFVALRGAGPVPPLGQLLDPMHGAWAAARYAELPRQASARLQGLGGPVDVRYDRRGVPHIFAGTEQDAMRALGYVVARDRLFQLDVQTHAGAGRLTEWAGAQALSADRETRQLGLPWAAEAKFAALTEGSVGRSLVDAYAEGVNSYIDGLSRDEWPIEYRLINRRPERWQAINSVHLLNRMGYTLAYSRQELARLTVASLVGAAAAKALFAPNSPIVEPIQPNGEHAPRFDYYNLPPPGAPNPAGETAVATRLRDVLALGAGDEDGKSLFASNNWAVAPGRSASGHAMLAGDPHLELTLPSIWYEAHLVVPGKIDVYGVTIPGLPGIIIGFNRDVAWSYTNTGADVLDLYRETVDSALHPTKYLLDGIWKPIRTRVETYRGPAGEAIAVDTLRLTHRGPMTFQSGAWLSMRWTVLETGDETRATYDAGHAKSAREFLDATARGYFAPAQNMIAADRQGQIAIRSTGHFPLRPNKGDGLGIFDGTSSASDWSGFWPVEKYPQSFNPAQGYLASANQQPIDPRDAFGYLADDASFDPWRALHINRLLRGDSSMTASQMRAFQTDPGSERADIFLPYFLRGAQAAKRTPSPSLDSAVAVLGSWDRRYTLTNTAAVLFEAAMRQLSRLTWDELNAPDGTRLANPGSAQLLNLLQDPENAWWDLRSTKDQVERRDDVLAAALAAAYDSVVARYGPHLGGDWVWDKRGAARINHLLRLPGFSELSVPVQGGPGTLNPSGPGGFGSSWRMVVELGPVVTAFGTYPGGQSGNPASSRYVDRVPYWSKGQLDTLYTPSSASALPAVASLSTLTLTPGRP